MVVDTSAVVAIAFNEPEAALFSATISRARRPLLSAASWLETAILVDSRRGPHKRRDLDLLLKSLGLVTESVTFAQVEIARDAYIRYGKGNHPARLNFGDCFAYALAKERGLPLLFKGNDFSRTDLQPALP